MFEVIAVRQKILGKFVRDLGLFWKFLEEAFSRKSLVNSNGEADLSQVNFRMDVNMSSIE